MILEYLGLFYFIILHELGHALAAVHKNIFLGFAIKNLNPAVHITQYNKQVLASGFILNLLTIYTIMPLLNVNLWGYLLMCVAISILDIADIKRGHWKKEDCILKSSSLTEASK